MHGCNAKYRLDAVATRSRFAARGPAGRRGKAGTQGATRVPRIEARRDHRADQSKVAARAAPRATEAELKHGVPLFFDQLIDTLKGSTIQASDMDASATKAWQRHASLGVQRGPGGSRLRRPVSGRDRAGVRAQRADHHRRISHVEPLSRRRYRPGRHRVWATARAVAGRPRKRERMGALAHELRNRLNTAMLSFGILKGGTVAITAVPEHSSIAA